MAYKVVDVLLNPQILLEDLIILIRNNLDRQLLVWREQYNIIIDSFPLEKFLWRWDLLMATNVFEIGQRKQFGILRGRPHLGKFFIYPIWMDILQNGRIKISQIRNSEYVEEIIKISCLSSCHFLRFWKEIIKNPPQNQEDCFEYHIFDPPPKSIYGKNLWQIRIE